MSTVTWRKTRVGIEMEDSYEAEIMVEERWNGFACPRFTRETTEQIVKDIEAQNVKLVEGGAHPADMLYFEWDGDSLTVTQHYDPGDTYVETYEPDADGMYHLGSHEWTWSEVADA